LQLDTQKNKPAFCNAMLSSLHCKQRAQSRDATTRLIIVAKASMPIGLRQWF